MRTSPHRPALLLLALLLVVAAACGTKHADASPDSGGPSAKAKMICSDEVQTGLTNTLELAHKPKPKSTWADDLYTCTYDLPPGKLVLSVKQLPTDDAANQLYTSTKAALGPGEPMNTSQNIGRAAFQNRDGVVIVVKDNFLLTADPRGLKATVGPNGTSRSAFAYNVAVDVLACWSGG